MNTGVNGKAREYCPVPLEFGTRKFTDMEVHYTLLERKLLICIGHSLKLPL